MYRLYEEKEKIREIQKYLAETESGKYDSSIEERIIKIKEQYGLASDSTVDYQTFRLIYSLYEEKRLIKWIYRRCGVGEFPIRIHSYGEYMKKINKALIRLSDYYKIQTNLRECNYYGERSEAVLDELAEIYRIEKRCGELDTRLLSTLLRDFQALLTHND